MINIVPVILCGGNGTRLWPQSRKNSPKQFQRILGENTMFADTLKRVSGMGRPVVITNQAHQAEVEKQLQELHCKADIVIEPVGRNTAPAIAVAASLIYKRNRNAVMVVLPSDHLIKDDKAFDRALGLAIKAAGKERLVTFGIKPHRPETGYGYIRLGTPDALAAPVQEFVEKPDQETAERYLADGNYVWNSGMFVFRASLVLTEIQRFQPELLDTAKQALANASVQDAVIKLGEEEFKLCRNVSIDYAVMEVTDKASCITLDAHWNDLGGWGAVWEESEQDATGNALTGDVESIDTRQCLVQGSDRLIATVGVEDLVIVDTPDSLLVAHRDSCHQVKDIVSRLEHEGREESVSHQEVRRPWGTYTSVDKGERHQVKHITVDPGQSLSKQMHHHRSEHWIIVAGAALVEIDGEERLLSENESCFIPTGAVHRLTNPGKVLLRLVEVQNGSYLGEDDIVRFDDIYGRVA